MKPRSSLVPALAFSAFACGGLLEQGARELNDSGTALLDDDGGAEAGDNSSTSAVSCPGEDFQCKDGGPGPCPITLTSTRGQAPSAVALDATNVYWTDPRLYHGSIMKISKCGGSATTLATGREQSTNIAVDGTSVYWADSYSAGLTRPGLLVKVPIEGGTPVTLASAPRASAPCGLALDANSAYWVTVTNTDVDPPPTTVMKVPLDGGMSTTLAAVAESGAYDLGDSVRCALAVDSTSVYWSTYRSILKVSLKGGAVTTLASEQTVPNFLAIDAESVYWTTTGGPPGAYLMKVPLMGGTPTTLASQLEYASGLALDSSSVYWAESVPRSDDLSAAMKMPLGGGAPTTLVEEPNALNYIAVDGTSLYWSGTGLMKLTPK
jgi:sugar lactone lactonase YvrE